MELTGVTWLALVLLGVIVAYPVLLLLLQSVFPGLLAGDLSGAFSAYAAVLRTEGVFEMLVNSVAWAAATTVVSWMIGVPTGMLLARGAIPLRPLVRLLFLIPIMTPPYVFALSYTMVMVPGGFLDAWVGGSDALRRAFFSFGGVTFVMALSSFGYVTLAVEAAMHGIPARLEQAATMLGASPVTRLRFVVLPLLRPALLNSGLLVFLDALSNFGVPAILGPRANLPLLPAEIHSLVTSWPVDFPLATALSSLLVLLSVKCLLVSRRLLAAHPEASARATPAVASRASVGRRAASAVFVGMVFLLSVVVPYGSMVLTSLVERWNDGALELTWRHYREILSVGSRGCEALLTSLWLSAVAASGCVLLGGTVAYVVARRRGALVQWLDAVTVLPRGLPKIVMAVALIQAWNAPWVQVPVYNSVGMLLIAYVALYVSDALRYGDAGMRQVAPRLEHAASLLGAGRFMTFVSVTFPLLLPTLGAAWIVTFIVCMRDLVASVILLPPDVETVGSFIFNQFEQGDVAAAMTMATVVILFSTAVLLVVKRGSK